MKILRMNFMTPILLILLYGVIFQIQFHTFKAFGKASHSSRHVALNLYVVYSASVSMIESRIASPERLSYWAFKPEREKQAY